MVFSQNRAQSCKRRDLSMCKQVRRYQEQTARRASARDRSRGEVRRWFAFADGSQETHLRATNSVLAVPRFPSRLLRNVVTRYFILKSVSHPTTISCDKETASCFIAIRFAGALLAFLFSQSLGNPRRAPARFGFNTRNFVVVVAIVFLPSSSGTSRRPFSFSRDLLRKVAACGIVFTR